MYRLLFAFISLILVTQAASASDDIGAISELRGTGEVIRDTNYSAELGFGIFSMDDVQTGNGRIKIDFVDGSELRITEQSRILIDEFVFDPDPDASKMAVTFLSGTARFATSKTGRINQENVSIKTPTAQISVRGTDFTVTVDEMGRSLVILLPDNTGLPSGEILVATAAGSVVLNQSFQSTVAHLFEQTPTNPVILDLTVDMIDNMLIVNPPREVRTTVSTSDSAQVNDGLDSSELDVDFLEFTEEPQEIEFDRLDFDALNVDFLSDLMDELIEQDGLADQQRTPGSRLQLEGTQFGTDTATNLTTFVESGEVFMSRDADGKIQLQLSAESSYNITFAVSGRTFNVLINGGESNTINIRQSQ